MSQKVPKSKSEIVSTGYRFFGWKFRENLTQDWWTNFTYEFTLILPNDGEIAFAGLSVGLEMAQTVVIEIWT